MWRGRELEEEETGYLLAVTGERAEQLEGGGVKDEDDTRGEADRQLQVGVEQGSDGAIYT